MPQWPHEWVRRQKWEGDLPWENVVQYLRDHGRLGFFGKGRLKRHYWSYAGKRYWSLGWGLSVTAIINRDDDVPVPYLVFEPPPEPKIENIPKMTEAPQKPRKGPNVAPEPSISETDHGRRVAPIETDNQPLIRDGKGLMWARKQLGWSMLEMAENLRMEGPPDKLKGRIHEMEIGTRNVSGPITVAVEAFLWGFRPSDRAGEG
jgi:hypothetical protein